MKYYRLYIKVQIQKSLDASLEHSAEYLYNFSIIFVKNKNQNQIQKRHSGLWKPYYDYDTFSFGLSETRDVMAKLVNKTYIYIIIELRAAFWQIKIWAEDRHLTAFSDHNLNHFE